MVMGIDTSSIQFMTKDRCRAWPQTVSPGQQQPVAMAGRVPAVGWLLPVT